MPQVHAARNKLELFLNFEYHDSLETKAGLKDSKV